MNSKSHQFSRQQLFELVWELPITSVAKTIGVSDVWLSKVCKKAGIPIPPRGYWARRKAGRHVPVAILPLRGFGVSDFIRINDRYDYYRSRDNLDAELPAPPEFSESAHEVILRAQSAVAKCHFPKTLSNPHQLIEKALKEDKLRKELTLSDQFYFKKPVFDTREGMRKLKILNSIFSVMEYVGEKPYLRGTEAIELGVVVGDTRIGFEIEAINQKFQANVNRNKSRARTNLRLEIIHHYEIPESQTVWQDGNDENLEDQIRKISAGLLIAGEFLYRAQQQRKYNWLVERKAQHEEDKRVEREKLERDRLERQLHLERKRRRQLISDVLRWRRADEIREFVAEVNTRAESNIQPGSIEKLNKWSEWALYEADEMDPMKRSLDEVVDYLYGV